MTNAHCGERGASMVTGDVVVLCFWAVVLIGSFLAFLITGEYQSQWWSTSVGWWGDGGDSVEIQWSLWGEGAKEPFGVRRPE
jgi:hypothetical protein